MKGMKVSRKSFFRLLFLMVILLVSTTQVMAQKVFLTLGTSSPGGVFYPLGGGMAVVIEKVTGFRCAAESTAGSIENSRLLGNKELDLAMTMGSVAYNAVKGLAPFTEKLDLVTLFQMYPAPEHIVALPNSGIKSIEDLKGKRVSIDVPGSGTGVMAEIILKAYGFDLDKDLKIARLTQSEVAPAMKDGIIDAYFMISAYPASTMLDLAATKNGLTLLPIKPAIMDKILKEYPYFIRTTVPAGTYPGVTSDILCLGDSNLVIANRSMKEDIAYKVVKAIFENATKGEWALNKIHPVANQFIPANGINTPLELHPGAIKYFKEVGALK